MPAFLRTILGPLLALFGLRMGKGRDRRRAARHACDDRGCNMGAIVDYSSTGARVRCRRFYRPATGRRVTIDLPAGIAGPALSIPGTVCWVSLEDSEWHAGVAFDRPQQETLAGPPSPDRRTLARKSGDLFRSDWSANSAA